MGELALAHGGNILSAEQVIARGGQVQTAEDIHQGRFAGAALPDNGEKFALLHRHGNTVQRVDRVFSPVVNFINIP